MNVTAASGQLTRLWVIGSLSAIAIALQLAVDGPVGQLILMTLFVVTLMVLAVVFRAEREIPLLCDPLVIVLTFMAQFFVIGAPALFLLKFYIFRPMSPERGVLVLGLFALFVLAFFVGYQIRLGQTLAGFLPDFESPRRRMPWIWLESAIVLAGVAGCVVFVESQGGVLAILRTGYGRGVQKPIYQLAYHTLLAGTFLTAWRAFHRQKRGVRAWAPLVLLVSGEVLFFGVLSGARKWLFYIFFGIVSMWLLRRGSRALPKVRVALTLVALVVFFSIWGTIRSQPLTELVGATGTDPRTAARDPFHMGYFKSVSEPFEVASLVVDVYPSQKPYAHGRTLLVTLLGFIPRSAWPEKPIGIGKELTRYTDGVLFQRASGHSIAPTLVGDFYANFGAFGVILGGLGFGLVCRIVAAYATYGMRNGLQLHAARVILPSVFVGGLAEVRGDSASMLAFYIMTMIPIVVACALSRLESSVESV